MKRLLMHVKNGERFLESRVRKQEVNVTIKVFITIIFIYL